MKVHLLEDATCAKNGTETSKCDRCDKTYTRTKLDTKLTTHTPGEAVIENEITATCIDDGSYDEVIYCTVCKTEISRETKIIESELVDHTPGEAVVKNETSATCTDEGSYDEVIYCTKCNAEISRETKTIGKLSHSYVLIDAKSETCTQNGNEAYYICDTCKSIFNVDNEIIEDVPVIPRLTILTKMRTEFATVAKWFSAKQKKLRLRKHTPSLVRFVLSLQKMCLAILCFLQSMVLFI